MGLEKLVQSAKRFGRDAVVAGMIASLGVLEGCTSSRYFTYTNYENPEQFYASEESEEMSQSGSDILATIGAVMGVTADSEKGAAIGNALMTYGSLRSNKEAAREGKTQVIVQQAPQMGPAVTDATQVPEYNLPLLKRFYQDGHLIVDGWVETDYLKKAIPLGKIVPILGDETDTYAGVAPVDGLQYIFTYNRAIDLDGNGLSFDEFLGVKKNFRKGEPVKVCIGIRGSAMEVKESVDPSKKKQTTAKVNLRLSDENNNLLEETKFEQSFADFNQDRNFYWDLSSIDLDPGFYIVEAKYSDDFDSKVNRRKWATKGSKFGVLFTNKTGVEMSKTLEKEITVLRQFFEIFE